MRKVMNPKDRKVAIAETRGGLEAEFLNFVDNPGGGNFGKLKSRMMTYQNLVCNVRDDETLLRED